ncbi:MAG TPA: hypothetical protein VK121_09655 [Pseudogracilibacillus sp.]|nr:hypothetical protein [Pseudogracilibacillus sp.]
MYKKLIYVTSCLVFMLMLSGCHSAKNVETELNLIKDIFIETEENQYYYDLVENLLNNKQDTQTLALTKKELHASKQKLNSLSLKTKEAKNVKENYLKALREREKVVMLLEKEQLNKKEINELKKYLLASKENELKAREIIIKELNLKDIEE